MAEAREVFVVTDENSMFLLNDLCKLKDIKKYIIYNPKNKFLKLIKKIHVGLTVGKILWLPKRDVWFDKKYIITNIPSNGYLLVNSSVMVVPTVDFWLEIKKERPDVKFVLLLVDSMNVIGGHMVKTRERLKAIKWDIVLSYDVNDCRQYGFTYINFDYYSPIKAHEETLIENDLYYIARTKAGRDNILQQIDDACADKKVERLFQIVSQWRKISFGKCLREVIPYEEIVDNIKKTNCILEILQKGQNMQTIRYLEAICYNKKLLTNNENIVNYPFYNKNYMKCFKTVQDIDWEWVKKREYVEYEGGNFSAANILKYI